MIRKIAHAAMALALVLALGTVATAPAEARGRGGGVAAGLAIGTLLGLGIAGAAGPRAYAYDAPPGCYRGPRECRWVGRRCWENQFGETVCRGGDYRCWRPTYCD